MITLTASLKGELLRLRETVDAIKRESESEKEAMTEQIRQQAGEIGEKEGELLRLRETVKVIKRESESEKQVMTGQMQQQASVIIMRSTEARSLVQQNLSQQQALAQVREEASRLITSKNDEIALFKEGSEGLAASLSTVMSKNEAMTRQMQQQASAIAEKEGEVLRLRETVNAIKGESESEKLVMQGLITQQAGEIAEKEGELLWLREAQQHLQARLEASRPVLESCAQQNTELQQLRCSGEAP